MRILVFMLSVGLVACSATAAQAAPRTSSPPDAGIGSSGPTRTVTLVTGDRVVLAGHRVVGHLAGEGRHAITVETSEENGHIFVVPGDAAPLIAEGKVDRRLFDVTSLVEFGYDDAHRDTVPLIVRQRSGVLRAAGTLSALDAVAVPAKKPTVAGTWETIKGGGVEKVWLDGLRQPVLDRSVGQIGAPAAWQSGWTGKGVKVAVLDTGVDATHPDLRGREIAEQNFTGDPDATDLVGHGTHVAATIASNGSQYRGVAPDAQLLDGKVCTVGGCPESAIAAGMQWAVDQGAGVVNMSLGGPDDQGVDPLEEAVDRLSRETGALFVVAAGNSGGPATIGSPGSAEQALTVGAVDRDDKIAPFSSRGPTYGGGAVKPDVTAPGVGIVAAKAKDGYSGTPVDEGHVSMSGTSMATPHVAGAVALLKQQHPDWKGTQLKAALMASAKSDPELTAFDQGAGRVDVAASSTRQLVAEPGNIDLGVQQWPHADDEKATREITYHNSGAEPVALDLSVELDGPGGEPAPAGLLSVTPAALTVPAGGSTTATVTGDTSIAAPDGAYTGTIVAGSTRTLISITREVESYDVTFRYVDADGKPTPNVQALLLNVQNGRSVRTSHESGTARLRVPKGEYFASAAIRTGADGLALLTRPALVVDGPGEFVFDARAAKPISVRPPEAAATPLAASVSIGRPVNGRPFTQSWGFSTLDTVSVAHLGPDAKDFTSMIGAQFAGAPVDAQTPVTYRFAWEQRGRFPTGFTRTVAQHELAEVRTGFVAGPAGSEAMIGVAAANRSAALTPVPVGGRSVDRLLADGARWSFTYFQRSDARGFDLATFSALETYRAKHTYEQRLNTAVHGPTLDRALPSVRRGNDIAVSLPMFGDGRGSPGDSATTSAGTVLTRDGKQVGASRAPGFGRFTVPAADGAYRLEVSATRDSAELTTSVSAAFTFRSSLVDGEKPLPLSVVRFKPELSETDSARLGLLRVPLVVQQQDGTPRLRRIEVEASFDDGKTWHRAPVIGHTALVFNERPGFASLRAKSVDAAGNTSEVTLTRAYRVTR